MSVSPIAGLSALSFPGPSNREGRPAGCWWDFIWKLERPALLARHEETLRFSVHTLSSPEISLRCRPLTGYPAISRGSL